MTAENHPAADHETAGGHRPTTGRNIADRWTRDHGASAERTRLAWRRTGLSATAVGLLAARPAFAPHAGTGFALAAAAAMTGWAALIALAYRRSRGLEARPPLPGRRTIAAYALITLGFAVLGGLVVLL